MLEAAIDGRIELMLVAPVLDELERILTVKLGFAAERVGEIVTLLRELSGAHTAATTTTPEPIAGDPDDDVILACAVQAGAQILASGDRKRLLPLTEHRGVRILTPQALLAELANA